MKKLFLLALHPWVVSSALAQDIPLGPSLVPTSEIDVANAYIKALESQLVWRIQQVNYLNDKIKGWEQYAKPLYEPQKVGEK